jgi:hypothetical protein
MLSGILYAVDCSSDPRRDTTPRAPMKLSAPAAPRRHRARVKDHDGYLFVLPSGARRHGVDPERLRSAAELQCFEGWILGCREGPRPGGARSRRRVLVTPLGTVGAPVGTLAAALARAGAREGCTYFLFVTDGTR